MNIAIIGLGRIGKRLAEFFGFRGHSVVTLAKTMHPTAWFHTTKMSELLLHKPEVVFIASGMARPDSGDYRTEKNSTIELLPQTLDKNIRRLIYISSGAVYGECELAKKELDNPKPSTRYGLAKLLTEQSFGEKYSEISCSIRVSNVVDAENPYGLFHRIVDLFHYSRPLTLVGSPFDCRDYISIEDFLSICEYLTLPGTLPPIINVGSGESLTLRDIAEFVENSGVDKSLVSWTPARSTDVSMTRLDVTLVKSLSSIHPNHSANVVKLFLERLS